MSIKGLEELQAKLDQIKKTAEDLDGTNVPITEIFTDDFVQGCSRFSSLDELFVSGGYSPSSAEELDAMLGEEFDGFINSNTSHENWESFKVAALSKFAEKKFSL